MANLVTLEGNYNYNSMDQILDRLFDCNDVLGSMIYGPNIWNKIKNYVANLATKEIVLNRGKINLCASYKKTNDMLDKTFGFNDQLGVQLMGSNWDRFKNNCKSAAPTLGSNFFKNLIVDPIQKSLTALMPASSSPTDLFRFATGLQQMDTAIDTARSITGINEREANKAAAAAEEARQEALRLQELALQEAEKNRELELKKAAAKAEADAAASYQATVDTNPNTLQAQTINILILGGLGLAALLLMRKK